MKIPFLPVHVMLQKTLEAVKENVRQDIVAKTNMQFSGLLRNNFSLQKQIAILTRRKSKPEYSRQNTEVRMKKKIKNAVYSVAEK